MKTKCNLSVRGCVEHERHPNHERTNRHYCAKGIMRFDMKTCMGQWWIIDRDRVIAMCAEESYARKIVSALNESTELSKLKPRKRKPKP